jgi:hypothetical protein
MFAMRRPPENWKGKWFCRMGWRVFPKTRESEVRALIEEQKDEYHHQLEWSLDEIESRSKDESRLIAREFIKAARNASEDCPLLLGASMADKRKHGWKHVTYGDVEILAQRAKNPSAAAMRLESLGVSRIKHLFLEALNRDPQSVAVLTRAFPDQQERQWMASYYMGIGKSKWKGASIPSAADLAAEYVTIIYREPDSEAARKARRSLEFLLTTKAIKGQPVRPGKPTVAIHKRYLKEAVFVGRTLFKQVRAVHRLLGRCETEGDSHGRVMSQLYPWIASLREGSEPLTLLDFLPMKPGEAALYMVRTVIGVSPRKLEKILYSPRSPKRPHK